MNPSSYVNHCRHVLALPTRSLSRPTATILLHTLSFDHGETELGLTHEARELVAAVENGNSIRLELANMMDGDGYEDHDLSTPIPGVQFQLGISDWTVDSNQQSTIKYTPYADPTDTTRNRRSLRCSRQQERQEGLSSR